MTLDNNNLEELATIVVLCYLIAESYKLIFKKKHHKYIPIVVGLFGGMLSVLIFLIYKETFNTNNIFEVFAIGIISGLASTGTNQILKQILRKE